jgi:hypothetical protein
MQIGDERRQSRAMDGLLKSGALVVLVSLAAGCAGNDYLAALPTREGLAINVPGASDATSAAKARNEAAQLGAPATFYLLTRQVATQLNGDAAIFFDMIDQAVATPPTAHDATHEYWGPFTPALSPMTIVLAVQPVDAEDYNFFLGGKPKSAPNSAFTGLLGGSAHQVDATHGSGQLEVNFSTLSSLDPTTSSATGAIAFVHSNIADPRTVEVHFGNFLDGTAGATPLNATYQYAEHADTSGSFQFALLTNFDNDPNGDLEDVTLQSRWLASGAGRADLVATGGDLPAGFVVHATECWDASFARVFYTDDVDPSKTEGSVSACALP